MSNEDLRNEFMDYFIEIENELNKFSNNKDDTLSVKLNKASARSPKIRSFNEEIKRFAELRNVYSHSPVRQLAIPHEDALKEIRHMRDEILKPKNAYDIASNQISQFKSDDFLDVVLEEVRIKDYSQFPIFENNGNLVALLTENGIVKWLAKKAIEEIVAIDETKIEELLDDDEKSQNYRFVSRNRDIYYIQDLFQKPDVEAVFVTETGKANEKILGIITIWDIK